MLFNPGHLKIIRTSTTPGPRTWQTLLSNTQHQHLGECSVKQAVLAWSLHSCFLQHNITVIADPGRFKFQFLRTETPPCPAYCWQKALATVASYGLLKVHFQLKKKELKKQFLFLLAFSSQARHRWLTAREGSAQPGVLAVTGTLTQSVAAAAVSSSC